MSTVFKHLSFEQVHQLRVGDRIDHRDYVGRFLLATVISISKESAKVKVHYVGWKDKWDTISNYYIELFRFAAPGSISGRASHRVEMKHLKIGDKVDVNVKKRSYRSGWTVAVIKRFDTKSGQIQVQYTSQEGYAARRFLYWVHLDNSEEIDIHGRAKYKHKIPVLTTDSLPIWLETRHSLKDTPQHLISSCADDIIQHIFGGMENVMDILINNANESQLQQISSTIKQKNINYKESQKQFKTETIQQDDDSHDTKPKHITQLSSDEIQHICGYLTRNDIVSFKLTSYKHCMLCLKEMKKYQIGILNTNQLIDDTHKNYTDVLDFASVKHMTIDRYISGTKYSYLLSLWQRRYAIPNAMQLLFTKNGNTIHSYTVEQMVNLSIQEIEFPYFCVLDKRNTIVFDPKLNVHKIMDENDKMNDNDSVVFLQWFDIFFQQIIPLQFMILNPNNITYDTLIQYVMTAFIATTNHQQKWHSQLLLYLNEMNDTLTNKNIIVHRLTLCKSTHGLNNTIKTIDNLQQTLKATQNGTIQLIFQLNHNHGRFKNSKFATIQEKCDLISNNQ